MPRPAAQKMREDLPRTLDEEGILVGLVGEERSGQRQRLGLVAHLGAKIPVGHARVERVQDDVATLRAKEARRVLARRVVDDRCLATLGDLHEHPANER